MEPTTIKSVIERVEPPTSSTMFWSRLPGKVVDKFSGQNSTVSSIKDPNTWTQSLLTIIKDQSNQIHRKSMYRSADFIVSNGFGFVLLKSLISYQPLVTKKSNIEIGVNFVDAIQKGLLDKRFTVFTSKSIPENKLLLGLAGNGMDFKIRNNVTDIPEIDIEPTDNPYHQIGQVAYWSYIEILDINL